MTNTIPHLQKLLEADSAYVTDGHVLCYGNVAPPRPYDYDTSPYLKRNESDVLLWTPHTILGLRADKCVQAPWGAGHPTINASRLADGR